MEEFVEKAISIIYPNICVLCGKNIEADKCLCEKCRDDLEYIEEPMCKKCGKQLTQNEQEYCDDCKNKHHYFECGMGIFSYNEKIRKAIYDFKYNNMKSYAKFFGQQMATRSKKQLAYWKPEAIIPVPVSRKKYLKRGYNQAQLIGRELSRLTGIPMDTKILYRIRDTKPQKDMSKNERKKNLESAFIITENIVKYEVVVLVDDIYTTGSTIDECAKTLKEAGVSKVYFLSQSIGAGI